MADCQGIQSVGNCPTIGNIPVSIGILRNSRYLFFQIKALGKPGHSEGDIYNTFPDKHENSLRSLNTDERIVRHDGNDAGDDEAAKNLDLVRNTLP